MSVARARLVERVRQQTLATFELLRRFDSHYSSLRREAGVLLFSDLPRELRRGMQDGQDGAEGLAPEIYWRLDARVQHLLIDEFQDTSLGQWTVLRPLAEEIRAWGDGSRTIICVGDPKQAIYGWRGGCADLFDRLQEDLKLEGSAEERLNGSWRAAVGVLDCVNAVFSSLAGAPCLEAHRGVVEKWSAGFEEHFAYRRHPGYVELRVSDPALGGHEEWVAERLAQMRERLPHHSVAVLAQTNDQAARLLESLRRQGLSASGEGGSRVNDDPAVALIQGLLTLADHPGDSIAAFRVESSPLAGAVGLGSVKAESAAGSVAEASRGLRRLWVERGARGSWELGSRLCPVDAIGGGRSASARCWSW